MKKVVNVVLFLFIAGLGTSPVVMDQSKPQGGTPVENTTVIVRGKTIEYVGPENGGTVPQGAQIIDATGRTVMPGLADLHVHLQGGWDGTSVDLIGYQRYLNAMLYSGSVDWVSIGY